MNRKIIQLKINFALTRTEICIKSEFQHKFYSQNASIRVMAMAKADLGLKRSCSACGMRFYDFNRKPIICPGCSAEFDPENAVKVRKSRAVKATDKQEEASNDDVVVEEVAETSFDDNLPSDDGGPDADAIGYDEGEADEEEGGLIQDNIAPDDELLTNIRSGDDD